MPNAYTYQTQSAGDLLNEIAKAGKGILVEPEGAKAGDIIGVRVSTKSSAGRSGYALAYHIDDFVTADGNGGFDVTNFTYIAEENKASAALLAMHINQMNLAHTSEISGALSDLDDQDGDLYANMLILPSMILISRDMYEDLIEIFEDDPQETQDQINSAFIVLCETDISKHRELQLHSAHARDLKIIQELEPIRVDFSDYETPGFTMSLDIV